MSFCGSVYLSASSYLSIHVMIIDDFISTVVNFDPSLLTSKQIKLVQDEYLSNTELDYNSVDRASKACGE